MVEVEFMPHGPEETEKYRLSDWRAYFFHFNGAINQPFLVE